MGANMLIESIGLKAKDRCLIDKDWVRSAIAQARLAINAIDEKRLAEINDEQGIAYADIERCKQELTGDLTEVESAVLGDHRQAATVAGGNGIVLLVSGGMSWGDSPTELFDSMTRLLQADVFPDARWPEPDQSHITQSSDRPSNSDDTTP